MSASALVVGGRGYVGRELCEQLFRRGDRVTTLNRSLKPADVQYEWLQADITVKASLDKALANRRFDVVYHVASLPGDTGDPVQMMTVNILGLTNMLVFARDTKASRFVLSSSISAYEWYPATKFVPPVSMPVDRAPSLPSPRHVFQQQADAGNPGHDLLASIPVPHNRPSPHRRYRTARPGRRSRLARICRETRRRKNRADPPLLSRRSLPLCGLSRRGRHAHCRRRTPRLPVGRYSTVAGPSAISGREFADIVRNHFPGVAVDVGFPWSMAQGGKIAFSMKKGERFDRFHPPPQHGRFHRRHQRLDCPGAAWETNRGWRRINRSARAWRLNSRPPNSVPP